MKINKKMNMRQFAIEIARALKEKDIDVILTGGAVVSIYSKGKYVSKDLDFLSPAEHSEIRSAMNELGFENKGKDFYHKDTLFSVEFPGYHLVIGDEPMKPEGKIKSNKFVLKLLSPTQCVMDRLAAQHHPINFKKIETWSRNEGMLDRYDIFLQGLQEAKKVR